MFDIQKFITNHIKKGTLKNLSSETKSSKYLYMTLVCLLVYTMNKYKKNNSSHISNNCNSCGSPVNKCSCSCSSSSESSSCDSSSEYTPCPPPCPPQPCETSSSSCETSSSCENSSSSCENSSSCVTSDSSSSSYPCGGCNNCNNCRKNCGEPYVDYCSATFCKQYTSNCCVNPCYLSILVNENHLCIPQFNLRNVPGCIDFFYSFYVCNLSSTNINSLIMIKDLLQWMTTGVTIGPDVLPDDIYTVMFVYKDRCGNLCCYEYLKIFVNTDECGTRTAFVSKGKDYLCIVDKINFLLIGCEGCPLILDLLNGSEYFTYNITDTCPITLIQFLSALLSLYLIPDCLLGKQIIYDVSYCNENQKQLEYFYQFFNCESGISTNC